MAASVSVTVFVCNSQIKNDIAKHIATRISFVGFNIKCLLEELKETIHILLIKILIFTENLIILFFEQT